MFGSKDAGMHSKDPLTVMVLLDVMVYILTEVDV